MQRPNPLRVTEQEDRLAKRLPGRQLPDVHLPIAHGGTVPLLSHVNGLKIVYFLPGETRFHTPRGNAKGTADEEQLRGLVNLAETFARLRVGLLGIASYDPTDLPHVGLRAGVRHLLLADPDLEIARALGLPTTDDGGVKRYRRIALVTRDGHIHKMFRAVPDIQAADSARQVLGWLEAAGAL